MIYLDSCILIYLVESIEPWNSKIRLRISGQPEQAFAISDLVPDALHLAAASAHGCEEFWTNDHRLIQIAGHRLKVVSVS